MAGAGWFPGTDEVGDLQRVTEQAAGLIRDGARPRPRWVRFVRSTGRAYGIRSVVYVVDNPDDPTESREITRRELIVRDLVFNPRGEVSRRLTVLVDRTVNLENIRVRLESEVDDSSAEGFATATDLDRIRFWIDLGGEFGRILRWDLASEDYLKLRYLSDTAKVAAGVWVKERREGLGMDVGHAADHSGVASKELIRIEKGELGIPTRLVDVIEGLEAALREQTRIVKARDPFLSRVSLEARLVLPYLHLPTPLLLERAPPMTGHHLQYVVGRMLREFGLRNRRELVHEIVRSRAMRFPVKRLPPLTAFTLRERQVGSRLHQVDGDIAEELGLTYQAVLATVRSLRRKSGQTESHKLTREELVVMADSIPGFAPTQAELDALPLDPYAGFSPLESKVIPLLHLPSIWAMLDELEEPHSYDSVKQAIISGQHKVGANSRVGFALEMSRRGVEYHINMPETPLSELADSEDLAVVGFGALVHTNKRIAKDKKIEDPKDVDYAVSRVKADLGSRSRVETALILQRAQAEGQNFGTRSPNRGLAVA